MIMTIFDTYEASTDSYPESQGGQVRLGFLAAGEVKSCSGNSQHETAQNGATSGQVKKSFSGQSGWLFFSGSESAKLAGFPSVPMTMRQSTR